MLKRVWNSRRWRIVIAAVAGLLVVSLLGGCAAVTVAPGVGAQAADWLRGIIGDEAVAQLETFVFQVQDDVHQLAYSLGVAQPESPRQGTPIADVPTDAQPLEPTGAAVTPTFIGTPI